MGLENGINPDIYPYHSRYRRRDTCNCPQPCRCHNAYYNQRRVYNDQYRYPQLQQEQQLYPGNEYHHQQQHWITHQPIINTNDICRLQAIVNDYLKSLQPHKEKQEQLKNAFTDLYERLSNFGPADRHQLDTFQRCLDKLDKTLDNKHLHAVKHEISQHLEGVQNAAKNDQYDCILPRLEALLAVLNNFQERIITNLQSNEKQPKQPPPPFEPIRPIFGGGPGGGGMIGNLLEEASQNNSPELLSPSNTKLTTVKNRTKKLREKRDDFETDSSRLQEARDAYLMEMRRQTKTEFRVPLCFVELAESSYHKLMSECAPYEVINRHLRDMHSITDFYEELPLVYIANMCFPAYDPSTESAHGSKDKLESEKYRAVENLIKSISPNLNEETRQKLATEILHEIRPSRWQLQCEQAVLLVFGCSGLISTRKIDNSTKTTIDKSGKQITVDISSKWILEWVQGATEKREITAIKANYRISFVTLNRVKDDDNCGEVKLNISVTSFKQKQPSLFQRTKTKLDNEKHLLACLLSGTFEQKEKPKLKQQQHPAARSPMSLPRSFPAPHTTRVPELPLSESPRPIHYKQPSEPILNTWSSGKNQSSLIQPGGLQILPDYFVKNKFHSNDYSTTIQRPINDYYQPGRQQTNSGVSGSQIAPPSSIDKQYKARSWPRNPGTNSFGLAPDDASIQNDPEYRKYVNMQTSVVNAQPHSYLPAPAPGVIPDPDPKRYDWNDENNETTLRESLKASTLGSVTLGENSKDFYLNGGTSDFDEPSMIDQSNYPRNLSNSHRRTASLTGVKFGDNWNEGMSH